MNNSSFNAGMAFAAGLLAHEMRSPFTTMAMFLRILERSGDTAIPEDIVEQCLASVRKSKKNINDVIAEICLFDPQRPLEKRPCTIDGLFAAAAEEALNPEIRVEMDWRHSCEVEVDEAMLVQALTLLLRYEFQAPGGTGPLFITGCDTAENGSHHLQVNLRRKGISLLNSNQFPAAPIGRFGRIKGLGLALCKQVTARHGGCCWVGCGNQDEGRELIFWLPTKMNTTARPRVALF